MKLYFYEKNIFGKTIARVQGVNSTFGGENSNSHMLNVKTTLKAL